MFTWNNPYVLSVLIGLVVCLLYHFDQKQKKNIPEKIEYVKVFGGITGSLILFHLLSSSDLPTIKASTSSKQSGTGGSYHDYSDLKIKTGVPDF